MKLSMNSIDDMRKDVGKDIDKIYVEQPIDERIYRIVEDFVQPYTTRKIELKKEGNTIQYVRESTGDKYKSFNVCVAFLVAAYLQASEKIKYIARQLKQENQQHGISEQFLAFQDAYRGWNKRLRDIAFDLLHAINFANGQKLIEDGSVKQIEELESKKKECDANLANARRRIVQLETYMRIHKLNPDDANDTIVSDPYEGGDNH